MGVLIIEIKEPLVLSKLMFDKLFIKCYRYQMEVKSRQTLLLSTNSNLVEDLKFINESSKQ